MIDDCYGDYYTGMILTGNIDRTKKDINKTKLKLLINSGLSSVKIAKKLNCSYTLILRYTDTYIPSFSGKLRENGRKHKIRRANAKN